MAIIEIIGGPITHKYLMGKTKHELADMYMRLLRETARDAEDAARYRWLREQNTILDNPGAWTITRCDFTDEEDPSRYWVGSDLDAAIDAARAGERG